MVTEKEMGHEMEKAYAELEKMELADLEILKTVKGLASEKDFLAIMEEVEDGYTYCYSITDKPDGEAQNEDWWENGDRYVDQTCNGGFTGDTFEGTVCIAIGHGKYFKFHYEM